RTPAAQEALANFHDHRINNSRIDLRFCFLTNAAIGSEQLNPFPNRVPGITLWEQIRTRQLDDKEIPVAVAGLQKFLSNLPKPDGLAQAVWTAWMGYLTTATTEVFKEYIDRFEWSTGRPDAKQLSNELPDLMMSLGFARDEVEAKAIFDRLFVYVT